VTDLREAMREAVQGKVAVVDVPEWGEKIRIRQLSVKEQIKLTEDDPRPEVATIRVLLVSMVDEDGKRRLGDEDMDLLLDQPFPVIMPLLAEAAKLNGLTNEELEKAMSAFASARDERPSTDSPSLSGVPSQNSKPSPVRS
jgi:hypothetical protein